MPTQEDRLTAVENDLKRFKSESVKSYHDVVIDLAMVKALALGAFDGLAAIRMQVTDFRQDVIERFERQDVRFEGQDAHLNMHDKRFDEHDKRFDVLDKRLEAHDKRFDVMDQRFDVMDQRFDVMDNKLDQVLLILVNLTRNS
ncbi:hypothetical protein ccbrp13_48050 [Ktedonobacteria bacterium brp13]|nr:hypothetical protein ccbrp13_48050 [Ktedonobacteria bacterium brp13]